MWAIVYNFPSVFVLYIHKTLLCPFIVHVYTDCPYKSSMVVRDVQETPVIHSVSDQGETHAKMFLTQCLHSQRLRIYVSHLGTV